MRPFECTEGRVDRLDIHSLCCTEGLLGSWAGMKLLRHMILEATELPWMGEIAGAMHWNLSSVELFVGCDWCQWC